MRFVVKIHEINGKKIIAVCDEELLGKRFESREFVLYLDPLYFGTAMAEFPEELMNEPNVIVHAVGENIVNKLKTMGLIDDADVLHIANVPVVMFYNIREE